MKKRVFAALMAGDGWCYGNYDVWNYFRIC